MVVNPFVRATRAGGACVRGPVHAEMVDPEVASVGGPALERAEARLAASTALGMARGAVALYECCVGSRVRPVPSSRCGGLEGDCGGGRGWVAYPASSPASVGTSCGSSVTCRVLGSSGRVGGGREFPRQGSVLLDPTRMECLFLGFQGLREPQVRVRGGAPCGRGGAGRSSRFVGGRGPRRPSPRLGVQGPSCGLPPGS